MFEPRFTRGSVICCQWSTKQLG